MAGVIGVGKTTAAGILAQSLDLPLLCEPVDEVEFLALFYEAGCQRFNLELQVEFLERRTEQLRRFEAEHRIGYVLDRSVEEDQLIFTQMMFEDGSIPPEGMQLYSRLVARLYTPNLRPDLVVMIDSPSVDELLDRINSRGRVMESTVTAEYLKRLIEQYTTFPERCHQLGTSVVRFSSHRDVRTRRGAADLSRFVISGLSLLSGPVAYPGSIGGNR